MRTLSMDRSHGYLLLIAAGAIFTVALLVAASLSSQKAGAASLVNDGLVEIEASLQDDQDDPAALARQQHVEEFEAMERAPGLFTVPEQPIFDFDAMERAPGLFTVEEQEPLDFDAMERAPGLYTDSADDAESEDEGETDTDSAVDDYVTLFEIMKRTPGVFIE